MNRNIVTPLSLMAVLTLAAGAASAAGPMQFGLGAGISSETSSISVPIRTGNLLIEPELSYYSTEVEGDFGDYDYSELGLGVGVYLMSSVAPSVELALGGRGGITSSNYEPDVGTDSEESGFFFGPVVGGEYFFNKHFSAGIDAAVIYATSTYESGTFEEDSSSLSTETRARLRFYM